MQSVRAPAAMVRGSAAAPRTLPPRLSLARPAPSDPLRARTHLAASSSSSSGPDEPAKGSATGKGPLQRLKEFFVGDGLTKEKLASLGAGAFASYAVISNVTYGICVSVAWIAFVKQTGLSPLEPGQWKGKCSTETTRGLLRKRSNRGQKEAQQGGGKGVAYYSGVL